MPKLGLTMKEGMIMEWLVKEGDTIKQGEPLFVIETEKITEELTNKLYELKDAYGDTPELEETHMPFKKQ